MRFGVADFRVTVFFFFILGLGMYEESILRIPKKIGFIGSR